MARYPDIAAAIADDADFDAFAHFCAFGIAEGRRPSYAFDPVVTLAEVGRRLGAAQQVRDVWWLYFAMPPAERPIPNNWFDATWFRARHGGSNDWDAFASYLERVENDALSPNGWFDEAAYRAARGDAISAGGYPSGFAHFWASTVA